MARYSPFGDYLDLSGELFSAKREMEVKNQKGQDRQPNPVNGLSSVNIRETLRRPLSYTPSSAYSDGTCSSSDSGLRWPRPRYASGSSGDTDISEDTCVRSDSCLSTSENVDDRDYVCVTGDSKFRFFLPSIPDSSGRPILAQKPESRPEHPPDYDHKQQQRLQQLQQQHNLQQHLHRNQPHQCIVPSENMMGKSMGESIYGDDDFDKWEVMSSASDVRSSLHRYDASPEVSASSMGGMMERFVTEVVEKRFRDRFQRPTICVFCQRNGETVEYYSTHMLKDIRGKVICPILRNYVCPKCKATGDNAHTLRHCPVSRCQASVSETFKTPRTSCGFRKF